MDAYKVKQLTDSIEQLKELNEQFAKEKFWIKEKVTLAFEGNMFSRDYEFSFDRFDWPGRFMQVLFNEVNASTQKAFREKLPDIIKKMEDELRAEVAA